MVKLVRDPLLILVVLLGLWAGWWLLKPGYFNMHDDLQMMRQLAMEGCFKDLQFPCRWTQYMGYGFGFPLFNYYPPLPYLVGEVIRLAGFSFVTTVKITFLLSVVISGVAMYIFVRELWGRLGGLVSAAFYIWAPYHSLDVFVRGAMNEAWALSWFPLILWSSYKLVKEHRFKYIVILALSWFALFTSHNLMVMIFAPVFAGWVLLWLVREKAWFVIPRLVVSGIWSFGLAAFFTLPVFLEKGLVKVESMFVGYYEYVAHFASIRQLLFSRFWGYGASAWTEADGMSFYVGHTHWVLAIVIFLLVLLRYLKRRKLDNLLLITCYFFALGWFATFMAHSRSTPIWLAFPFLKFVQFPWRFITLSIFSFSILAGGLIMLLQSLKRSTLLGFVTVVLVVTVIVANREFFRPEKMGPLTDKEKFSAAAWELQQTAGIYDYLPRGAKTAPKESQKTVADVIYSEGQITDSSQGTSWAKFNVNIGSDEAKVRINIFQFPNWKVFVDKKEVETYIDEKEEWGRMYITIPQGEHEIAVHLYNTPVRTLGNTISLVSWLALLTAPVWRKKR
ncbi:MAG: hypothetical protein HYU80_01855 [Candidatus Blackburnbacteria bacterium]|nr:hypothetical protein [Candidatus Blackburnbacteria bacterium]